MIGRRAPTVAGPSRSLVTTTVAVPPPVRPQQLVVRSMVREFVDRVFDGSARPLLVHLLKEKGLTEREKRELQKLLDKARVDKEGK